MHAISVASPLPVRTRWSPIAPFKSANADSSFLPTCPRPPTAHVALSHLGIDHAKIRVRAWHRDLQRLKSHTFDLTNRLGHCAGYQNLVGPCSVFTELAGSV